MTPELVLYHAPLACSLAARLALHESGLSHQVVMVRTGNGEHRTPEFLAINPGGKVPALQTGDGVLTETVAILPFIADLVPGKALFPDRGYDRARAQSILGFLATTLHPAFTRSMFPERFTSARDPEMSEGIKEEAIERLIEALTHVDRLCDGRPSLLDAFSVCDLHLLVFCLWRQSPALAGRLPALANLDALQRAVLGRPGIMALVGEDMAARTAA